MQRVFVRIPCQSASGNTHLEAVTESSEVMNSFNAYFFLVIRARSRLPAHVVSIYETQNWAEIAQKVAGVAVSCGLIAGGVSENIV